MEENNAQQNSPIASGIEKIRAYAEKESSNGFIWVYRAEGDLDAKHISDGRENLAGTWFSPSFSFAESMISQLTERQIPNPHLVAIIIPKSMLDQRDDMQKGMSEINVIFRNQVNVRQIEKEIDKKPDANEYISQFDPELLGENSATLQ